MRKRSSKASTIVYPAVTLVVALLIWEVLTRFNVTPSYALPAPMDVLHVLVRQWAVLFTNAVSTTIAILLGFCASVAFGIPLAVLITTSPVFQKSVYPMLIGSQAVPKLALAPLFVVWFGFGMLPKVLITFLIAVFPIVVSTILGLAAVDVELEYLARSMGLGRYRTFRMIRLYKALPNIFAGLKVAITLAVVGAVVGEFTGSDRGLGTLMLRAIGVVNTPMLFAALIVLTVLAIVLFALIELLERFVIPWHVSQRSH
jgi:NitT/TauT family transport system permease protein